MKNISLAGSFCMRIVGPVVIICVVLCCIVAWGAIGVIDEDADVQNPQTLVRTEVTIDTSALPENPTIQDWYPIGLQVLQDNGWDLSPNLTSIGTFASCESDLVLDEVQMDFVDRYFDGPRPCIKKGWVSLNRHTDTAEVWINYQALRWRHSRGIDLAEVEIGSQEALEIADRHGGQDYRDSVANKCKLSVHLGSQGWRIGYRGDESGRWEMWAIVVDAATGEAEIDWP